MGWFEDAVEFVGDVVEDVVETAKDVVDAVADAAGDAADAAGDAASAADKAVRDFVGDLNDWLGRGPEGPLHPIPAEEEGQDGGQTVEQALVTDKESVLTPAQEAAERVKEAWDEGKESSSPTSPVMTAAQEAAQKVKEAWEETHTSDRDEIIKKAVERLEHRETLLEPEFGQGPGPIPGPHGDAGNAFTDLIRAAQNPTGSGLGTVQPPVLEATGILYQMAKGDVAGHVPHDGVHEVTTAATAAVAEADHGQIDQHHASAAPVLDHFQVAHH